MGIRIEAPKQDGNARFETLKVNLTENTTTTRGVVVDNDGNFYYGTPSPASGSAFPYTGSAEILGNLIVSGTISTTQGITGSLYGTASWALNALTASYVDAANVVGLNLSRITTGSVTASVNTNVNAFLVTSQSIELFKVNSSGSVIHGSGSVSSGSYQTIVGKFNQSSSVQGAFIIGNGTSDSSRSNLLLAQNNTVDITGSVNITGSTTQIGNNTLLGNTILSGSIIISGALGTNNPTIRIYGDTQLDGYIRFDPVTTNINTSISASYIYVSGSTNDLYFSQNGEGYSNVTRLRWLEGNLYTGLLHGGLISSASSTTFNISSGSGIIVNLGASLTNDPYPTIKYIQWPSLNNQALTYRTSSIQTFVGIDDTGNIIQQITPWNNGQYNTSISIGTVLHQNLSTINGSITYPNVAYGYKQRTYDFIKAFGPLKLSGYTILPSSSLGLTITGGTAFADGRNYQVDPNNPSYIVDSGTNVSKIFRYYQSGSTFVQNTNGGLGYTVIDPANYNPNSAGILTAISPSTPWSNQRIFWYPNSATKGIVVYYGTQVYASQTDAIANLQYETFNETPNTQQNAIYLGAITVKYNATFTNPADFTILPAGIFRSVGGSGGGGGVPTGRLVDLSDVNITSPTNAQPLAYNSSTSKWTNQSSLNIDITGNAATATSSSYAATASFVTSSNVYGPFGANSILSSSYAISSSYSLTSSFATSASYSLSSSFTVSSSLAQTASYITSSRVFGPFGFDSIQTSSLALTASSADNFIVRQSLTASNALISNTLTVQTIIAQTITSSTDFVTGSTRFGTLLTNTHDFTGSVRITGSLNITGPTTINNLTGSLFGTASWAQNAQTASFITASNVFGPFGSNSILSSSFAVSSSLAQSSSFATTASFATSASFTQTASFATSSSFTTTASFALSASQAISSSFSTTSSFAISSSFSISASFTISSSFATSASLAQTASFITASNVFGPFGSNSVLSSSFATSSSFAQSSSFATSTSFAISASQAATSSFSLTASFVNPLRQIVQITGSLAVTGSAAVTGSLGISGSITINTNGENRVLASTFRPAGAVGSNLYIGHAGTTNTGTGGNSSYNTSVGIAALDSNTTGYINTAVGMSALTSNNTGFSNSAVGYISLQSVTNGTNNAALGDQSLYLLNGSFNTAVGSLAGGNVQIATASVYIGYNALGSDGSTTATTNNEIVIGANTVGGGSNTVTLGNSSIVRTLLRKNVGIDTTNPLAALDVNGMIIGGTSSSVDGAAILVGKYSPNLGHITTFGSNQSSGGPVIGYNVYPSSSFNHFISSITSSISIARSAFAADSTFRWYTGPAQAVNIGLSASLSQRMILTNAGNLGIGVASPSLALEVSGSASITGSLNTSGIITAPGVTASLFGTASWSQNAVTASFTTSASFATSASLAQTASFTVSASFASTASSADNFTVRQSLTASNALINNTLTVQTIVAQTITSSTDFVTGSTRFGTLLTNTHQFTGSVSMTGSLTVIGQTTINNLTGSLFGTASWAFNAVTASFTTSASFATSASLAQTASFTISSSFATSASLAQTASFTTSASFATSASLAQTASFITSSRVFGPHGANSVLSSSFAVSASWAPSAGLSGGATNYIAIWNSPTSISSSLLLQSPGLVTAYGLLASYTEQTGAGTNLFYLQNRDTTAGILHQTRFGTQQLGGGISRTLLYAASPNTSDTAGELAIITENGGSNIATIGKYTSGTSNTISLFNSGSPVTEKVRINSTGSSYFIGGDVGIGTSTPNARLTVAGNGTGTALIGDLFGGGNYTGISLNGSSGTTSYNFLSGPDGNLFINRPTAGNIYFRVGNADQVIISGSNGHVGIGTISPIYKLVVSNAGANGLEIDPGTVVANRNLLINYNRGTSAYTSIQIDAATTILGIRGNVGVGTETPSFPLMVASGSTNACKGIGIGTSVYTTLGQTLSGAMTILGHNVYVDTNNNNSVRVINSTWIPSMIKLYYNEGITFHTTGSEQSANSIFYTGSVTNERMRISIDGNVGIGTTSPSYRLDVSGSARTFSAQSGGGVNIIDLQNTDNTAGVTHLARFGVQQQGSGVGRTLLYAASPDSSNTAGDLTILTENGGSIIATIGKSGTNNTISLYNSGSPVLERVRLHSAGNSFFTGGDVAIGISVPTARLHVSGTTGAIFEVDGAGTAGANALYVNSSGNVGIATASPSYRLDVSGSARVTASLAVGNILPSATVGRIDAANDVVAFSTSDIRFKTNLTPIDNAIDKITTISGYEFDWIPNQEYHGYEGRDIGIIAQEIEKVLPQVVTTRDSGYKAVKYEKIVPLLIQAIKEQQTQIDELRYLLQNKT